MRDGIFWMLLSLGILAVGWLYPAWFLGRDPIMQRDTDLRLGAARGGCFLFCLMACFVFAVLGVRSFHHVRGSRSPTAAK